MENKIKNIHLIPTDKPSRLYSFYGMLEDLSFGKTFTIVNKEIAKINKHKNLKEYQAKLIEANWKSENIYITNNEEIKEGDYFLYDETEIRYKTNGTEYHGRDLCHISGNRRYPVNKSKKIILTIDQSLDVVQKISDEFLEWFIKNPSCESVKWNAYPISPNGNIVATNRPYPFEGLISNFKIQYEIIIPKEEPKQETLEEARDAYNALQERSYSEEDMKNAFDSAREFNSLDGTVDVHIVLPMGGDMSDLQPLHFTFEEWFEQFKKK